MFENRELSDGDAAFEKRFRRTVGKSKLQAAQQLNTLLFQ